MLHQQVQQRKAAIPTVQLRTRVLLIAAHRLTAKQIEMMMEMARENVLTKEEIEKWIYRCAIDEDAADMEFETSYVEHCLTAVKLQSRLSETEFQTFAGLAYNKCRHMHQPSEPWSAEEQAQLERFQDKAINRSEKKMDKISTKQEKKRVDNDVSGQPVRIKCSGRIGVGVGSLDPKASKGILVRFDGGDSEFVEDREDLEIICPICNKGADRLCSKCKRAWYCGRDCQVSHWKEHKKSCKEMAAAASSNKDEDPSRQLDIARAYVAKEAQD